MIESKSLKVGVSMEQTMIDTMQCFGWNLQSSQEINVKESHLESRYGDTYSVTTHENYIKLVFARDTNMANYSQIKSLENKYFSVLNRRPSGINGKVAFILLLFSIFPGVIYLAVKIAKNKAWENEFNSVAIPARNNAVSLIR